MHVGICVFRLHLPENGSLKDKRRIIKSVTTQIRDRYGVSIAEVADHDLWQVSTLGISCVSASARQSMETMAKIRDFIDHSRFEIEIVDWETDIVPFP